jgi:hypothetical protein
MDNCILNAFLARSINHQMYKGAAQVVTPETQQRKNSIKLFLTSNKRYGAGKRFTQNGG